MPRATKCGRLMTHNEDVPPITSHDLSVTWSCEVTYKLNTLYLHFHKTNRHQILQGGDLPWGTFTHKVIWSFKQMVMWDRVTRWKQYISNSTIPITTKFFRMLTYDEGLQPIKSHNHLVMWSSKPCYKLKTFYLHYHNASCHQT